jgi:signal transduction histidine kinase
MTEIDDDIGEIKMAVQDIESVVVNLVSNAIAAMEGRSGEVLVRVKAQQKQAGSVLVPSVLIEVKDEGIGIMPEYENRIFEPFFTTKDVGKGTGLGMWQVQALVTDAKGSIWFESVPDKGTRFFVELPVEPRETD